MTLRRSSRPSKEQESPVGEHGLIEKILEAAIRAADDFARLLDLKKMPVWQVMFQFARRLQAIPGALQLDISCLRGPVDVFCKRLCELGVESEHRDFYALDQRWIEFVNAWLKVKTPEGGGPLATAYKRALEDPVKLKNLPALGEKFETLISICFHLSRLNGGRFYLSQGDVGELLGTDRSHVGDLIGIMTRYDVIRVVTKADFTQKRATEYDLGRLLESYYVDPEPDTVAPSLTTEEKKKRFRELVEGIGKPIGTTKGSHQG
jgi:hypothetical protein